jgi:hypothetical protein
MAVRRGRSAEYSGVVGAARFCLQAQQRWATGLGHSNPNGPLQLRIANLSKAGTLERQGEVGLPSLLRPWVPRKFPAASDLESSRGRGRPLGHLRLQVAIANEASLCEQFEMRPKGDRF